MQWDDELKYTVVSEYFHNIKSRILLIEQTSFSENDLGTSWRIKIAALKLCQRISTDGIRV